MMASSKEVAQATDARTTESTLLRDRLRRLLSRLPCPVWLAQALKFLSVGVLNTLLDAGLYFVLTRWLGFAGHEVLAKGMSYGVGILNSFYWNKSWTFRSKASSWITFVPFVLSNLVGIAINTGAMYLGLNALSLPDTIALVLATGVTFLWNFAVSKFLIFRK